MENLEYKLDRTAVTSEFLNRISRDIPRVLSNALRISSLRLYTPSTSLGREATEEVYLLLRKSFNEARQKRNEAPLTDTQLVERLENDRNFYIKTLGIALIMSEIKPHPLGCG